MAVGDPVTIPSTVPTRSGYTFLGWSASASAASASYTAGDRFTPGGDTTLYAVWKPTPLFISSVSAASDGIAVTATVQNTSAVPLKVTCVFGVYEGDSRLVGIEAVDKAIVDSATIEFEKIHFQPRQAAYMVKCFLLKQGTFVPAAPAACCYVSDYLTDYPVGG